MKSIYFLFVGILLVLASSCDKYEKKRPEPVELSFSNPGIVEFKIRQMSTGERPDLKIDTMQIEIINQSNSNLGNINYVIRGFNEDKKEFAFFSYWQEQTYPQSIEPFSEDKIQQLSKSFDNIISYENLELDLMSYTIGNKSIAHKYSGSYKGNYSAYKDTVFQTFGAHYSWISYNGKITAYFDRGDFPWISFSGQIVNDSIVYGDIQMTDKKVNTSSPVADSLGSINFRFEFSTETNETYFLSLSLVKN